jgi:hypothetical protein
MPENGIEEAKMFWTIPVMSGTARCRPATNCTFRGKVQPLVIITARMFPVETYK